MAVRNTDSTFSRMGPLTCDSEATFFHSGSAANSPQFFRLLAARVRKQVDERVAGTAAGPAAAEVDDVGHAVLLEDAQRVVAETLVEIGELAVRARCRCAARRPWARTAPRRRRGADRPGCRRRNRWAAAGPTGGAASALGLSWARDYTERGELADYADYAVELSRCDRWRPLRGRLPGAKSCRTQANGILGLMSDGSSRQARAERPHRSLEPSGSRLRVRKSA